MTLLVTDKKRFKLSVEEALKYYTGRDIDYKKMLLDFFSKINL